MKRLLTLAAVATAAFTASAQEKEYPTPPKMSAAMTEVWTPQPKIVTTDDFDDKMVAAPSDAIVLYDGSNLDEWIGTDNAPVKWDSTNGVITASVGKAGIKTKRLFDDYQLHIEWSSPTEIEGESQKRGNSGVFMQGLYEIQILDNYNNKTYANGQAGSIYKQTPPLVNAMQKPGKWNVYDIIYRAPIFKNGKMVSNPTVTVLHNGVVVQNNTTILGKTEFIGMPKVIEHGKGPIMLQYHNNPVRFRNIWIREM